MVNVSYSPKMVNVSYSRAYINVVFACVQIWAGLESVHSAAYAIFNGLFR